MTPTSDHDDVVEPTITNHEEATLLAEMKRERSNLARCYLDLRLSLKEKDEEIGKLRDAHRQIWALDEKADVRAAIFIANCALSKESNTK